MLSLVMVAWLYWRCSCCWDWLTIFSANSILRLLSSTRLTRANNLL